VANKALNVASSAEEVLRTGVTRITDAGATAVEALETTIRSAKAPVLEGAGALGKTAKFLAGKAGGALLGAADTVQRFGGYVYKNVRAPAISLTTSAVTNAYDAANSLIKYSSTP